MVTKSTKLRNGIIFKYCRANFIALVLLAALLLLLACILMENIFVQKSSYPVIKIMKIWENYVAEDASNFEKNCRFEDYILGNPTNQDDPCLISVFKRTFLIAPPPTEDVNRDPLVTTGDIPSNTEKFKWVKNLLIDSPNKNLGSSGFYIECGANDGEFISPTIRLEKIYNWTGLLIEANPSPFKSLLKKKRNAYAVNAAVCTKPYPEKVSFYTNPKNTGMAGLNERDKFGVNVKLKIQCIPFYTMLAALELKIVDYLSLDVEGLELEILKTLPFDKIQFNVMTIEHWSIPGGKEALKKFLEPKGYKFVKVIEDVLTRDSLYVHESLYQNAVKLLNQ